MLLEHNMAAPCGQCYTSFLNKLFETYRVYVLINSWSHILQMVCSYLMTMVVQVFQLPLKALLI